MRTIRTKVYQFSELSKAAQETAIEVCAYYNVDSDWWQFIYEDAKNIGLKLNGFDLDRNKSAQGYFLESSTESAFSIIKEHGEECSTYKTAKAYLAEYDKLVEKHSDGKKLDVVAEGNEYEFDNDADELQDEFLKCLLNDYSCLLQNEHEYMTSREAIIETIEANEYEFKADGTRY
jgi:hypothetical protein